jgi:TonB family protein
LRATFEEANVSEDPTHGATKIEASKGGGGGSKWLLGAVAAVVLVGGGYFVWKNLAPGQDSTEIAYNDPYASDPLRATSDQDAVTDSATTDESVASPASTETQAAEPTRRSSARAAPVPEETIGITPINATPVGSDDAMPQDGDDIVITAAPRPIWVRMPSERRLSALYPERALDRGREGEARLHCTVQNGGALDCVRAEETPGFGNAALRVSRTLRHAPTLADGSDATGTPVNLRVVFRMADEDQRRG